MRDYSNFAITIAAIVCLQLTSVASGFWHKRLECGAFKPHLRLDKNEPARPGELPFIACVTVKQANGTSISCTASLLSTTKLLTSGECSVSGNQTDKVRVRIGSDDGFLEVRVKGEASVSPEVNSPDSPGEKSHRLAVYELAEPVRFTLRGDTRVNQICFKPDRAREIAESNRHLFMATYTDEDSISAPVRVKTVPCRSDDTDLLCTAKRSRSVKVDLQEGSPLFGKDGLFGKWHLIGVYCGCLRETDKIRPAFVPVYRSKIRDWLSQQL